MMIRTSHSLAACMLLGLLSIYATSATSNDAETGNSYQILEDDNVRDIEQESALSDERKTLVEELQTLKQEVLELNRDMFLLEEELLFPSNTQVAFFLSINSGQFFKLDSVALTLNDVALASHLYTNREVDALERGATHRIHTTNLKTGTHQLVAVVTGYGPEGRYYKRAIDLEFKKETGTRYIELKILDDVEKQQPRLEFKTW